MSHMNAMNKKDPWRQQIFLKDKLRCRERYYHPFQSENHDDVIQSQHQPKNGKNSSFILPTQVFIIPDAIFLRKYLDVWEELVSIILSSYNESDIFSILLLESAAEAMDTRNSFHDEIANPNERDRIAKLYLKARHHHSVNTIKNQVYRGIDIFQDLSYRIPEDEMDSFDFAHMPILVRSRHALLRAGRMLLFQKNDNGLTKSLQTQIHNKRRVILLSQDFTNEDKMSLLDNVNVPTASNENDINQKSSNPQIITSIYDLLLHLKTYPNTLTSSQFEEILELSQICEKNYDLRNSKSSQNSNIDSSEKNIWSMDAIRKGIEKKTIHKGKLQIKKRRKDETFIMISNTKYYISHKYGSIRALAGDTIAVQILPESAWEPAPLGQFQLFSSSSHSSSSHQDGGNDHQSHHDNADSNYRPPFPTTRILCVMEETGRRTIVATFQQQEQHLVTDDNGHTIINSKMKTPAQAGSEMVLVTPMDYRYPKIRISGKNRRVWANKRILVHIDSWNQEDRYANGHFIRVIGPVGDLETEISSLLIENEIDITPFSMSSLACLPVLDKQSQWFIPPEEVAKRKDLRNIPDLFIYSVDPPGCQDIDDTMHARELENGDVEVGVHIADVTYFVPQGCALDKEAAMKATTFYLVDRRFDMLPTLLSSDLCSLHGAKDRLAVSIIWTFDKNWKRKSTWMGRTIINNCQAMTYDQAHNILHSMPPDPTPLQKIPPLTAGAPVSTKIIPFLLKSLNLVTNFARFRKRYRETTGGAIDLTSSSPELKFELDANGHPIQVSPKENKEIHHTIAEIMIFANQCVAETIHEHFPSSSLLRVHKTVEKDTSELTSVMEKRGLAFDDSKKIKKDINLATSLQKIKEVESSKPLTTYIQSLATRVMSEAEYVCTENAPEEGWRHYGLGIDKYTHFTSPIRRYADIIVHRLLLASICKDEGNVERMKLETKMKNTKKHIFQQSVLIPESSTISILKGERTVKGVEEDEETLHKIVGDSSYLASKRKDSDDDNNNIQGNYQAKENGVMIQKHNDLDPYKSGEVTRICANLNQQNRLAKISSLECQSLFLSLYFRNHIDYTYAVIISLRTNGFLVYIPKFDLKGPIFLSDKDGKINIDPNIVGLNSKSGEPPSIEFANLEKYRKYPEGKCKLNVGSDQKDQSLKLEIPGSPKNCIFKPLDLVTVQLSCSTSDSIARIPPPRIHIVYGKDEFLNNKNKMNTSLKVTSKIIDECADSNQPIIQENVNKQDQAISMYKIIQSLKIDSNLSATNGNDPKDRRRSTKSNRVQTIAGRFVYNSFQNPDTHLATQKASAEFAMKQRDEYSSNLHSSQNGQNAMGEYDKNKKIERDVTSRIQRRAVEKRNTRRAKSTK